MGTKTSKQHQHSFSNQRQHHHHHHQIHNQAQAKWDHRVALAGDNMLRIANQENQNFNDFLPSKPAQIPFERAKPPSHNNSARKKHRHDLNIPRPALGMRKSRSTGNLSIAPVAFTDKRKHRNKSSSSQTSIHSSQHSSMVHSDSATSVNQISSSKLKRKQKQPFYQLALINTKDLQYVREIGKGNFGTVHHALYKGTHDVALKTLNVQDDNSTRDFLSENDEDMHELLKEATTMTCLRHANVLRIIGITFFGERQYLSLVTDFMKNGSLLDYLKKHRDIFLKTNPYFISKKLNHFGRQIYEAMIYLEERNIIHRDLAARNCLIGEEDTLKVADFGLTKLTEFGLYKGTHHSVCAPRWTSPEALFSSEFSSRSDVWSYGITLWEIYSLGDRPFGNMSYYALQTLLKNPSENLSRHLPKPRYFGSNETYTHIILPCLTYNVKMRPRFRDLKQRVLDILVNGI
ncbi:unnamed protein product [Adineta steineri]|uniref:Protein kinase domain-containing protein n=1 Tax=Adineta steineri TaxID=433720 RepID=A0A819EP00_9BILA|nr:unnamed protein product [Adineta steineri]